MLAHHQKTMRRLLLLTAWFIFSGFVVYAQQKIGTTIELDTLQKVFGILTVVGGIFVGYMTMRLAHKMAEQEIKFNDKLDHLKEEMSHKLDSMETKIELKFENRFLAVENKMATRHDINGLKQIMVLQHENVTQANKALEKQLDLAAQVYKRDKHE